MAVNSFREDEEQKQVMNRETILRLFRYLLAYKKTVAAVILIMAVTTAITMVNHCSLSMQWILILPWEI